MSLNGSTLKNGAVNHHTPDDAGYLKPVRLSCCFCKCPGQPKIYKNLWRLRCHLGRHHPLENWEPIVNQLYNLIKAGVIR